jgi:hypothetical protein
MPSNARASHTLRFRFPWQVTVHGHPRKKISERHYDQSSPK